MQRYLFSHRRMFLCGMRTHVRSEQSDQLQQGRRTKIDGTFQYMATVYSFIEHIRRRNAHSGVATINASSVDGQGQGHVELNVYTTYLLTISPNSCGRDVRQWEHLKDIHLPEIKSDDVGLLIGTVTPEMFWSLAERRGGRKEPVARKTLLDWIVLGLIIIIIIDHYTTISSIRFYFIFVCYHSFIHIFFHYHSFIHSQICEITARTSHENRWYFPVHVHGDRLFVYRTYKTTERAFWCVHPQRNNLKFKPNTVICTYNV